jgi:hypothetical protein
MFYVQNTMNCTALQWGDLELRVSVLRLQDYLAWMSGNEEIWVPPRSQAAVLLVSTLARGIRSVYSQRHARYNRRERRHTRALVAVRGWSARHRPSGYGSRVHHPLWSTSYHAWIMRRPHSVVRQ